MGWLRMSKFLEFVAAAALARALRSAASAACDAASGEQVFKRCTACQAVGEDAKNKVGPQLNGVVGRAAGTVEGFKYSKAMAAAGAGGLVWSAAALDAYLADPKGYIKGNRMSFAGLRKEAERADVIAYLNAFSAEDRKSTRLNSSH